MRDIVARATDRWREPAGMPGIDMGDGRVLEAEDVLDTYSARLLTERRAPATKTVSVQVDDNLVAAIEVLAPDLAKLTHLADEVAQAVPPVHPEAEFRQSLYEALERTHRQQAARRALGTHEPAAGASMRTMWLIGAAVLVLVWLLWWRTWRSRRSAQI
jgi:hypothetical protein